MTSPIRVLPQVHALDPRAEHLDPVLGELEGHDVPRGEVDEVVQDRRFTVRSKASSIASR